MGLEVEGKGARAGGGSGRGGRRGGNEGGGEACLRLNPRLGIEARLRRQPALGVRGVVACGGCCVGGGEGNRFGVWGLGFRGLGVFVLGAEKEEGVWVSCFGFRAWGLGVPVLGAERVERIGAGEGRAGRSRRG